MALARPRRQNSPSGSMKYCESIDRSSDSDTFKNLSIDSAQSSPSTSMTGRIASTLARSRFCHSLNSLNKTKQWSKFYVGDERNDKVLEAVKQDREIRTNPVHNKRRRTLLLMRKESENFGFTVQSYLLTRGNDTLEAERITYVDYVDIDSNAARAGVRAGDVIISINGKVVTDYSHEQLISFISSCLWMRMIVMFENIRERIDLAARSMQLQKILELKLEQLRFLEEQEERLLCEQGREELSSCESLPDLKTLSKKHERSETTNEADDCENSESGSTLTDADSLLADGNSLNSSDLSRDTDDVPKKELFDAVGFQHVLLVDDDSSGVQITRL